MFLWNSELLALRLELFDMKTELAYFISSPRHQQYNVEKAK